jgi:hypothetical protein
MMHPTARKFTWFIPAVIAGIALACVLIGCPTVTLSVISVQRASGSPTVRCEISNQGDRPVELTIHSIDQSPFYHRLERSGTSWRRVLWDMECGIDAQTKILSPGQTFPFTASIIDTSQPIRLAVNYRLDGADLIASSKTIFP